MSTTPHNQRPIEFEPRTTDLKMKRSGGLWLYEPAKIGTCFEVPVGDEYRLANVEDLWSILFTTGEGGKRNGCILSFDDLIFPIPEDRNFGQVQLDCKQTADVLRQLAEIFEKEVNNG